MHVHSTTRHILAHIVALCVFVCLWQLMARAADGRTADGVVTACGDDAEFSSILASGGHVSFNCGGTHAPAVIPLRSAKLISLATSIDGGGVVTLDGHNAAIPRDDKQFALGAGAALTLSNIALRNGFADTAHGAGDGGCIETGPASRLLLVNVTLLNCRAAGGSLGGGIYIAATASVTLLQSAVSGSSAMHGGGIYNAGTLMLSGSLLSGSIVTGSGGGVANAGSAVLNATSILSNSATQNGGGIQNSGSLVLDGAHVSGNAATSGGGLINQGGSVTIRRTTLDGNQALGSGGGIQNSGNATLDASTLSNNLADSGGGGITNNYALTLTNVTRSANSAAFGGGIDNIASLTLTNVTLAGNVASDGGGLYQFPGGSLRLDNSIVAYSPAGGNCSGDIAGALYSLSSDDTCVLTGDGNLTNTNPLLSALGNYGWPALVHMPRQGSPAIDAVHGAAPLADQRGVPRPQPAGGRPDMGAVERRASDSDPPPQLYLPLVAR